MTEPVPVSPAAQAVETPETAEHFARQRERHIETRVATARRSGRKRGDELLRRPDFVWDAVTEGLESQRRMAHEAVTARRVDLARAEGELARVAERLRARTRGVDPRLDSADIDAVPVLRECGLWDCRTVVFDGRFCSPEHEREDAAFRAWLAERDGPGVRTDGETPK